MIKSLYLNIVFLVITFFVNAQEINQAQEDSAILKICNCYVVDSFKLHPYNLAFFKDLGTISYDYAVKKYNENLKIKPSDFSIIRENYKQFQSYIKKGGKIRNCIDDLENTYPNIFADNDGKDRLLKKIEIKQECTLFYYVTLAAKKMTN